MNRMTGSRNKNACLQIEDRRSKGVLTDINPPQDHTLSSAARPSHRVIRSFASLGRPRFAELSVAIFQFEWGSIKTLAALVQRTMDMSVTITGESAYVAIDSGECEVGWTTLQAA